jgi:predicted transcriptional regulator
VQSGNGLLAAVASQKCCLWVVDEFGKFMDAALKERGGNAFLNQVVTLMLKLYTKAGGNYTGAAHASGTKNAILEPHLCVLGLTTSGIFDNITGVQLRDGLLGRLAIWPIQERPAANMNIDGRRPVPEQLVERVRSWIEWTPEDFETGKPQPKSLMPTPECLLRITQHIQDIDKRMDAEFETRAAIWARVNARAIKLALVHRASRLDRDPGTVPDWASVRLELEDIDWGIKMANWLARTACSLIRETVVDSGATKTTQKVLKAITEAGSLTRQQLLSMMKSASAGEVSAAAKFLESKGLIKIESIKPKGPGRPSHRYVSVTKE